MDPNDLLSVLDLDGNPPEVEGSTKVLAESHPGPVPEASPTALAVDAWGLRRGRELVAESERLKTAGTDEYAAADFFGAAFDPDPVPVEACADRRRHRFVMHLLGTPAYRSLHAATRLDDTAAGIAAAHFAEQYARLESEDQTADGISAAADDALAAEVAALKAVSKAVEAAEAEVTELRVAATAVGLGVGRAG